MSDPFLGFGSVEALIAFCRFRERVALGLHRASGERLGACYMAVKRMREADVYTVADYLKAKGIVV